VGHAGPRPRVDRRRESPACGISRTAMFLAAAHLGLSHVSISPGLLASILSALRSDYAARPAGPARATRARRLRIAVRSGERPRAQPSRRLLPASESRIRPRRRARLPHGNPRGQPDARRPPHGGTIVVMSVRAALANLAWLAASGPAHRRFRRALQDPAAAQQ